MERYDIAIIGSGPAGLSAAITAKIRNKKIIVFGNDILSEKVMKAHEIKNYLGLGIVSGNEMKEAFSKHLQEMDIQITKEKVSAIYDMGDYFGIQGSPDIYEATAVILATGVVTEKTIEGEEQFLGKGVSYCATCDAMLYRDKVVAVVGYSKNEEKEAQFLAEIAKKVYYFPMYKQECGIAPQLISDGKIEVIKEKLIAIAGETSVTKLITENSPCGNGHTTECKGANNEDNSEDKNVYNVNGVFILRDNVAPSQLIRGIELDNNHVVVSRKMETSIKGCFACGDITGAPYQYIKSAGEGNVAALSAVSYIADK